MRVSYQVTQRFESSKRGELWTAGIVCAVADYAIKVSCNSSMAQLSHSAALILKALSLGYEFGFDVMEITGLPSGTVYPALRRLERDNLVKSHWESDEDAAFRSRNPRRYYTVTPEGKAANLAAAERYPLLARLLPEKSA